MSVQRLRTGEQFLSDLRTRPRTVYVDGERVTNVAEHAAFRGGARSLAGLFDFAAAPENREAMTFTPPDGGGPVWRCWQIARSHADLRAKRIAAEKWAELSFGLMGRTPDHVANFFAGYAAKPAFFGKYSENLVKFYRHARDTPVLRVGRDQLVDLRDAADGAGDQRVGPDAVVLVDHRLGTGVGAFILERRWRVAAGPVGVDRLVRRGAPHLPLIEHLQRRLARAAARRSQ